MTTLWLSRPEPTLIDISHAVGPIVIGDQQWKWLSDKELLMLKSDTNPDAKPWHGHAEQWNVITGTHSPLAGLTNLLNRPEFVRYGKPSLWGLSPNRTWLAWECQSTGDSGDCEAAHLDGTHLRPWAIWGFFLDDQHWINPEDTPYETPTTTVLDLQDGKVRHYLSEPPGATMVMAKPSPQQETILYHLQTDHFNPVRALLHVILPNISEASLCTESLWISKTDGTGFHEIGHVVHPPSKEKTIATGFEEDAFTSVGWLPSGKQVAFVYRKTLYVVPVK